MAFRRAFASLAALALVAWPIGARAQHDESIDDFIRNSQEPPAQTEEAPPGRLSANQVDQLTAPIALFPDALLAQVLMASTHPMELAAAEQWVRDTGNAQLKGDALTQALNGQPWDPSVKALVPFPDLLARMVGDPAWLQKLGDAVSMQHEEVMASVQRLRANAKSTGHLSSNDQLNVQQQGSDILIAPANPNVVYVPYYDPTVVYGPWPWAAYPPFYFPPPFGVGLSVGIGFGFGPGIFVGAGFPFWGWCGFDWGARTVVINENHIHEFPHEFHDFHGGEFHPHEFHDFHGGQFHGQPGTPHNFAAWTPARTPHMTSLQATRGTMHAPSATMRAPGGTIHGAPPAMGGAHTMGRAAPPPAHFSGGGHPSGFSGGGHPSGGVHISGGGHPSGGVHISGGGHPSGFSGGGHMGGGGGGHH